MYDIARRTIVALGLATAAGAVSAVCRAASVNRRTQIVGCIRWDAWYDDDVSTGQKPEEALSPAQFHYRVPFFGSVTGSNTVKINGNSQTVLDREIVYASQAGFDYWAFDGYPPPGSTSNPQFDGMGKALDLYLASQVRPRLRFCMLAQTPMWGTYNKLEPILDRDIKLMFHENYQRVLDNRPLYYLGFISDKDLDARWHGVSGLKRAVDYIKSSVAQGGSPPPYLVVLDFSPSRAVDLMRNLGCDAISSYAAPTNPAVAAPYRDLAHQTEAFWDKEAATGAHVVPTVMAGWDRRPRILREKPGANTRPASDPRRYFEPAEPDEIAAHLRRCLEWVAAHPDADPAQAVLIYAWNENDEGGWLIPTLGQGDTRLRSIERVLASPHPWGR